MGPVIALFNFTPDQRSVSMEEEFWGKEESRGQWLDLISGARPAIERGRMVMPPYVCYWLVYD